MIPETQVINDSGRANSFVYVPNPETGLNDQIRYDQFVWQLIKADTDKLMKAHAAMGVAGEAGELCDAIKKEIIYGKPIDRVNIVEECGDIRWYLQATMNLYGISEQEILQANADKLAKRYVGLKYSDAAAQARADKHPEE